MTKIINLYGGPGTGKSTHAAGLFYRMKQKSINCEYVQEYAKDKTWEDNAFTLKCQPYITAKQIFRQHRLLGKVDYIITDSPILNGLVYPGFYTDNGFDKWLLELRLSFSSNL